MQNIRVMAKYYSRITLARMSELLDLPPKVFKIVDKIILPRVHYSIIMQVSVSQNNHNFASSANLIVL